MIKKMMPLIFMGYFFMNSTWLTQAMATTNRNICGQMQCVKIQNGRLLVLAADNLSYTPFFIKGVGYQPMPIGRGPTWEYPDNPANGGTDLRPDNIYDDPSILTRDFPLLQHMNANTLRIWNGVNANNNQFPNYLTNAQTTTNSNTTQNTLDLADNYGLKVIAGFYLSGITFNADNSINSIGGLAKNTVLNNFIHYVNSLKNNRSILFWAIGNENNYGTTSPANAPLISIKDNLNSIFGTNMGLTIRIWLENQNILNPGDVNGTTDTIIQDLNSSTVVNLIQKQYPLQAATIISILKSYTQNRWTAQQLTSWYSFIDSMAKAAHAAEGATFHPVALVNGGITEIGNVADGASDAQLPNLDIWGANVYTGQSFGSLFKNYATQSKKPLWISEFGVDAWAVTNAVGINNWGSTPASDSGGAGVYDPTTQSNEDTQLSNEILNNSFVTIGGTLMEYSDEWWKPDQWYCTNGSSNDQTSSGTCNSHQKYFGYPWSNSVDNFTNEEWYGVMAISRPNAAPNVFPPDTMTPRPVYYSLQNLWQLDPWSVPLIPTGLSQTNSNYKITLSWTTSLGAASYNVKRAYTSGGPYTLLQSGITATRYTDPASEVGTVYYIVSAVNANGESPNSAPISVTATPPAPPAPTLSAVAGNGQVKLSWSWSTGVVSWNLQRSTINGGPYTPLQSGLIYQTYTDTSVKNGTTYYYVVSAVSFMQSPNSAQASATPQPPPATPAGLIATSGNNQVTLSWNAVAGASYYNIKKGSMAGGLYSYFTIASPTATSYIDNAVNNGNTYSYVVSAVNAYGESANSVPSTIALPALLRISCSSINVIEGSSVTCNANIQGTLSSEYWIVNGNPVASSNSVTHTWINVPAGTYSVLDVGTDRNTGKQIISNLVTVIVQPTTLTISCPRIASAGSSITCTAFVNGTVSSGYWMVNGNPTPASNSLIHTWTNVPAGFYNVQGVGIDGARGNQILSNAVSVAVY